MDAVAQHTCKGSGCDASPKDFIAVSLTLADKLRAPPKATGSFIGWLGASSHALGTGLKRPPAGCSG
jgi:hypothetical protein